MFTKDISHKKNNIRKFIFISDTDIKIKEQIIDFKYMYFLVMKGIKKICTLFLK